MTIKLDGLFKGCYKREGFTRNNAYLYSMDTLSKYDGEILNNVFNIFKVGDMIDSDYISVAEKVFEALPEIDSKDYEALKQKRRDVVALALVYFQEKRHPEINKYMRPKRNIEFEIAADIYGEDVEGFYNHDYTLKDSLVHKKVAKAKEFGLHSFDTDVPDKPNVSWDEHYFNICAQVARNSKCFSRRIGAILVRDKRIISTGYNGPAAGQPTCDYRWMLDSNFKKKFLGENATIDWTKLEGVCPRKIIGFKSGEGMEWCPAVHAEENTILNCARMGIKAKKTIMYMTCGIPCSKCLVKIINAGVQELVVSSITWYDETAQYLLENSDVKVRLYDFIDKSELYNFEEK